VPPRTLAPSCPALSLDGNGRFGSAGDTIESNYLHPNNCHSATAKNANGRE
jgi:hypothetical protein